MILDRLVSYKRQELARRRSIWPLARVREQAEAQKAAYDFAAALRGPTVQLIAEIKRASPSRGVFTPNLDATAVARLYAQNGSAAISVLTDEQFFLGSLDDLRAVVMARTPTPLSRRTREGMGVRGIPILRKDFTLDPYHVYEARAVGADAVLLIAALLDDVLLRDLLALTHELGMTALVEVHDEAELERALAANARVIGINKRDLRTFQVDLETTRRLHTLIPTDIIVVSESGIKTRADVERLAAYGIDAILVGEALVTASDIAAKVRELTGVKQ